MIQMIRLDKLHLSEHNVRKHGAEANLHELAASILARGVKQNLIGGASKKRGHYAIFAGGRRLLACLLLLAEKKIAGSYEVPVNVMTASDDEIAETSLAENFHREAMTPTDECRAFLHFIGTDGDIDAVAKRFGLTRKFIEGRIRLASLADPIFEALAQGKMTMEVAKAYGATADQAKQMAVFDQVANTWQETHPENIRRLILNNGIDGDHPIAKLVGLARYTEAGGRIEQDLFSTAETARWIDMEIAVGLGTELMNERAIELAGETGIGCIKPLLAPKSTWDDRDGLHAFLPAQAELTVDETARLDELQKQGDALADRLNSEVDDEMVAAGLEAELQALEQEAQRISNKPAAIPDELKPVVSQFLVIGADGEPVLETGYWSERVIAGTPTDAGGQGSVSLDPVQAVAKEQGLSQRLIDELSVHRRDILALHVANDPTLALDLMIFAMADKNVKYSDFALGTTIRAPRANDPVSSSQMPSNQAREQLRALEETLDHGWAEGQDVAARFDRFRALDDDARANWLAYSVAHSLEASLGVPKASRYNALHSHLGRTIGIDTKAWWRPTAENYFDKVTKGRMTTILDEIGGSMLSSRYASSKKADLAKACESLCGGRAIVEPEIREAAISWLPDAMRFDVVDDVKSTHEDLDDDTVDDEVIDGVADDDNDAAVASEPCTAEDNPLPVPELATAEA